MLSKLEARTLIEQELQSIAECEVVILDEATQDHDWGWVFFYQSREYVETGEPTSMLAGNAPYIINKSTGEIVVTGTARPTIEYVQDYQKRLQDGEHGAA